MKGLNVVGEVGPSCCWLEARLAKGLNAFQSIDIVFRERRAESESSVVSLGLGSRKKEDLMSDEESERIEGRDFVELEDEDGPTDAL